MSWYGYSCRNGGRRAAGSAFSRKYFFSSVRGRRRQPVTDRARMPDFRRRTGTCALSADIVFRAAAVAKKGCFSPGRGSCLHFFTTLVVAEYDFLSVKWQCGESVMRKSCLLRSQCSEVSGRCVRECLCGTCRFGQMRDVSGSRPPFGEIRLHLSNGFFYERREERQAAFDRRR